MSVDLNHLDQQLRGAIAQWRRALGGLRRAPTFETPSPLGAWPALCAVETRRELAALATMHPLGRMHIHVAEQAKEVRDSVACSGARPVEWLLAHADVDARWCLIHATHVTESETDAMAASGAVVGLCPVTEANLGDGIFPAARFLDKGGRIATGTDSNILIDPAQELRTLEYSQRLAHEARNVLASDEHRSVARRLFAASLAGGAQGRVHVPLRPLVRLGGAVGEGAGGGGGGAGTPAYPPTSAGLGKDSMSVPLSAPSIVAFHMSDGMPEP